MIIYLVFEDVDYVGDMYIAAFSTYEKAEVFIGNRRHLFVREVEVE